MFENILNEQRLIMKNILISRIKVAIVASGNNLIITGG